MSTQKFINSLPSDKKGHIIWGVTLSLYQLVFGLVSLLLPYDHSLLIAVSLAFGYGTFVAGPYKELYHDYYLKKGTPEWLDFLATETPILCTYLVFLIAYFN